MRNYLIAACVFRLVNICQTASADCFALAAKEYAVPEILLTTIVRVESNGHPYAINYRYYDYSGKKLNKSFFPATYIDAVSVVDYLWTNKYDFDLGFAQINSTNMRRLSINPHSLLDPCYNLQWGAYILRDNIDRYGFNWKAISKYNGSAAYAWKIYNSLAW